MILKCQNLAKYYGERELFSGLSFSLEKKEILAVVGRNGCGKSTLLKILAGELEADQGNVEISDEIRRAYLEQSVTSKEEDKRSGGERTRDGLNEVFDKKPGLMLLDEPTNHLDTDSIEALQQKLLSFAGSIILVSHDRYLIDKCATMILDLNTKPCKLYKCGFKDYLAQKELIKKTNERAIEKTMDKIRHEKKVIEKLKSYNREKSVKRAESREKLLDKIEVPEAFVDKATSINIKLSPYTRSGNDVIIGEDIHMSFGERHLLKGISFDLRAGEHVGIVGKNGTGKTTLFKMIMGKLPFSQGRIKLGANVFPGYYDQTMELVDNELSLFDQIRQDYSYLNDTDIRSTLAAFSFFEDDVNKRISALSGGERGRLMLCRLMLSEANFLLLDEPTNHLDMESSQILEDAINAYTGTVLFISHDRYFLNKCADRILEIDDGIMRNYLGNYDDYMEKRAQLIGLGHISGTKEPVAPKPNQPSESRLKWEEEKKNKALLESKKRNEKRVMEKIESIEAEIEEIDIQSALPQNASDHVVLGELMEKRQSLDEELTLLYQELEEYI